jgi:hypothetical protein|nr:MAG TPA: hypothetical protein [Caudoviricetes sp.]
MEGYSKTDKNRLNKITNDNIYDIDPIMENFTLLDDSIGKVDSVNMEGYNEDSEVSSEKSLTNYINYIWKKLGSIELTDLKVKVTTWANKTLDIVLKELKNKDAEIVNTMKEYKASVDEYSKNLGIYVARHEAANNKLEKLLKGVEMVDNL